MSSAVTAPQPPSRAPMGTPRPATTPAVRNVVTSMRGSDAIRKQVPPRRPETAGQQRALQRPPIDSTPSSRSPSPTAGGSIRTTPPKQPGAAASIAEAVITSAVEAGLARPLVCKSSDDGDAGTDGPMDRASTLLWAALEMQVGLSSEHRAYCCDTRAQAPVYDAVRSTLQASTERLLWHGTSWQSVTNILRRGFNRAYSGRHGSKLGVGTYFAACAEHALRFCDGGKPRALFLTKVLVGRFAKGAPGIVEPPASFDGKVVDSTVDDVDNPRIFCVFRDFQALPVGLVVVDR
eukprot:NODE_6683_length_1649_cov_1.948752.p1 GENE.NODE_6683_length_1649_cov_1.948752~~NODE_6683_length_1649_cov_1.948752.p1  ORF type:complete len:292 (+),score=70.19 NODE_6683_length_1649_cov_1.948752:342-1217(+)